MKISPQDISESHPMPALDVVEYLLSTGWTKVQIYSENGTDRAAVWEAPGRDIEIYLPLRSQARDYNQLLANAINQVARVEGRLAQQVLADLRVTRADVVRVRIGKTAGSQLPLADGPRLFAATADLMVAAASAAVEPRSAYSGRRPGQVQEFSRRAVFGQTEEGSFVVRVVVPLPPHLPGRQTSLSFASTEPTLLERPFHRQVTETLLSAVQSANQAATRAMLDQSLDPFRESVRYGVSADLCKALASMSSHEFLTELEISVTWSRIWPARMDRRVIGFSHEVLDVLGQAASFLHEVEPREDFELVGFVTHLHKEPGQESGEVVIMGMVDDRLRKVKVHLEANDYSIAVQAHDREEALALLGNLRKEGRQYRLEHPHRLRVLSEPSLAITDDA